MQIINSITPLRTALKLWQQQNLRIALVPTMGNLHAAHLQLIKTAKEHADRVVVSIFVNPLQFGPHEDYANYPRTLEHDQQLLLTVGADLLFVPTLEELFPHGTKSHTRIKLPPLAKQLCGISRPGHFDGMATIVTKFFNLMQPQVAVFGEKDFQQLTLIRRMSADLNIPVAIHSIATQREQDGLAISSRNSYLSPSERQQAPALFQVLSWIGEQIKAGNRDYANLARQGIEKLTRVGFKPDYLVLRQHPDLTAINKKTKSVIILAAAYLGKTRLIDNLVV